MQKVIIDSSVWVSFFLKDTNFQRAYALLARIFRKKDGRKILVPSIIYLEVINTLRRSKRNNEEIEEFKNFFKTKKKFQLVKTDEKIYVKAEEIGKRVQLKTLDLLILTTVFDLKINQFYTFDKKLRKAYIIIKHRWKWKKNPKNQSK